MSSLVTQIGLLVLRVFWILMTLLCPPAGVLLIGSAENPWVAFGLGIPFVIAIIFTRKELLFVVLLFGILQFFAGLSEPNTRQALAALALLVCAGGVWLFRSRFGEKDAPGENRPRPLPGTS